MTPKEKAKKILDKYSTYVVMWSGGLETSKQNIKQCALIVVDTILDDVGAKDWEDDEMIGANYWQEVKKEIELM